MIARPIRIAIVAENLYGGTGVHTSALADHLAGGSSEVTLIAYPLPPSSNTGSNRLPTSDRVRVVIPASLTTRRENQRALETATRRAQPDVIYFGKGSPDDGSLRLEAQLSRIAPLIIFEHDAPPLQVAHTPMHWEGWRPALGLHWRVPRLVYRLRHRIATRVLTNSSSTAAKQRTDYGGAVDEVVALGVNVRRFHPPLPQAGEGRRHELNLGMVCRPHVDMKGLDLAFTAIGEIQSAGRTPLRIIFPVALDQQGRIFELLDRCGATRSVRLVPPVSPEALPAFYASLDALLVASRFEGGPYTMLEAMACGTPVIATPVGLVPEVIEDGVNGIRVATTDSVPALVTAIERFGALTPEERRVMGEKAREVVVERHDAEHHFARLCAILHEVARR